MEWNSLMVVASVVWYATKMKFKLIITDTLINNNKYLKYLWNTNISTVLYARTVTHLSVWQA